MAKLPTRPVLLLVALTAGAFQIGIPSLLDDLSHSLPAEPRSLVADALNAWPLGESAVTVGDLLFPVMLLVLLARVREAWPRPVLALAGLYGLTALGELGLHHQDPDQPYWCAQLLHTCVYLAFFGAAWQFGGGRAGSSIVLAWLTITVTLLLVGLAAGWPISRATLPFEPFSSVLPFRLELLLGNPNKLASFLLFVSLCLSLSPTDMPYRRAALAGLISLAVLTHSRDLVGVIFLPTLAVSYGGRWRYGLAALQACLLGAMALGVMSLAWAVVPLSPRFPYLNLSHPGAYLAVAHQPYCRIFWQASWRDKLLGRGYSSLPGLYPGAQDPRLVESFVQGRLGPQADMTQEMSQLRGLYRPPHNAYLQMLDAGGLLWLGAFLALCLGPLVPVWPGPGGVQLRLALAFLGLCALESLSQDNIHYRWLFAGVGMAHGLLYRRPATSVSIKSEL